MNRAQRKERIEALVPTFRAAKASAAYFHVVCLANPTLVEGKGFRIRYIRDCCSELEDTYLIRAFAEFEVTLRDFWENGRGRATRPEAKSMIASLTSHLRVRPDDLDNVHAVREYRNALIHGGVLPAKVTLPAAQKYLCLFVSRLPKDW